MSSIKSAKKKTKKSSSATEALIAIYKTIASQMAEEYPSPDSADAAASDINFSSLQWIEKRDSERYPCKGSIIVYGEDRKVLSKGILRDIQLSGAAFEVEGLNPVIGQEVVIEFNAPARLANCYLKATVRRILGIEGKINAIIAVQFIDPSPLIQRKLQDFVIGLKDITHFWT